METIKQKVDASLANTYLESRRDYPVEAMLKQSTTLGDTIRAITAPIPEMVRNNNREWFETMWHNMEGLYNTPDRVQNGFTANGIKYPSLEEATFWARVSTNYRYNPEFVTPEGLPNFEKLRATGINPKTTSLPPWLQGIETQSRFNILKNARHWQDINARDSFNRFLENNNLTNVLKNGPIIINENSYVPKPVLQGALSDAIYNKVNQILKMGLAVDPNLMKELENKLTPDQLRDVRLKNTQEFLNQQRNAPDGIFKTVIDRKIQDRKNMYLRGDPTISEIEALRRATKEVIDEVTVNILGYNYSQGIGSQPTVSQPTVSQPTVSQPTPIQTVDRLPNWTLTDDYINTKLTEKDTFGSKSDDELYKSSPEYRKSKIITTNLSDIEVSGTAEGSLVFNDLKRFDVRALPNEVISGLITLSSSTRPEDYQKQNYAIAGINQYIKYLMDSGLAGQAETVLQSISLFAKNGDIAKEIRENPQLIYKLTGSTVRTMLANGGSTSTDFSYKVQQLSTTEAINFDLEVGKLLLSPTGTGGDRPIDGVRKDLAKRFPNSTVFGTSLSSLTDLDIVRLITESAKYEDVNAPILINGELNEKGLTGLSVIVNDILSSTLLQEGKLGVAIGLGGVIATTSNYIQNHVGESILYGAAGIGAGVILAPILGLTTLGGAVIGGTGAFLGESIHQGYKTLKQKLQGDITKEESRLFTPEQLTEFKNIATMTGTNKINAINTLNSYLDTRNVNKDNKITILSDITGLSNSDITDHIEATDNIKSIFTGKDITVPNDRVAKIMTNSFDGMLQFNTDLINSLESQLADLNPDDPKTEIIREKIDGLRLEANTILNVRQSLNTSSINEDDKKTGKFRGTTNTATQEPVNFDQNTTKEQLNAEKYVTANLYEDNPDKYISDDLRNRTIYDTIDIARKTKRKIIGLTDINAPEDAPTSAKSTSDALTRIQQLIRQNPNASYEQLRAMNQDLNKQRKLIVSDTALTHTLIAVQRNRNYGLSGYQRLVKLAYQTSGKQFEGFWELGREYANLNKTPLENSLYPHMTVEKHRLLTSGQPLITPNGQLNGKDDVSNKSIEMMFKDWFQDSVHRGNHEVEFVKYKRYFNLLEGRNFKQKVNNLLNTDLSHNEILNPIKQELISKFTEEQNAYVRDYAKIKNIIPMVQYELEDVERDGIIRKRVKYNADGSPIYHFVNDVPEFAHVDSENNRFERMAYRRSGFDPNQVKKYQNFETKNYNQIIQSIVETPEFATQFPEFDGKLTGQQLVWIDNHQTMKNYKSLENVRNKSFEKIINDLEEKVSTNSGVKITTNHQSIPDRYKVKTAEATMNQNAEDLINATTNPEVKKFVDDVYQSMPESPQTDDIKAKVNYIKGVNPELLSHLVNNVHTVTDNGIPVEKLNTSESSEAGGGGKGGKGGSGRPKWWERAQKLGTTGMREAKEIGIGAIRQTGKIAGRVGAGLVTSSLQSNLTPTPELNALNQAIEGAALGYQLRPHFDPEWNVTITGNVNLNSNIIATQLARNPNFPMSNLHDNDKFSLDNVPNVRNTFTVSVIRNGNKEYLRDVNGRPVSIHIQPNMGDKFSGNYRDMFHNTGVKYNSNYMNSVEADNEIYDRFVYHNKGVTK